MFLCVWLQRTWVSGAGLSFVLSLGVLGFPGKTLLAAGTGYPGGSAFPGSSSDYGTGASSSWPSSSSSSWPVGTSGQYDPSGTYSPGSGSGTTTSPATAGSDGPEFQVIPLDSNLDCNSVLLRGTQKFRGTAFLLPKAVISLSERHETLFEIIPASHGQFLLRFGLYFPRGNENLEISTANSHLNLQNCDTVKVQAEVNKTAKDESEKIHKVAVLPLMGINVRTDGTSQPYHIGTSETALLNYQGLDHIVEFQIPDRENLDMILKRITGPLGMEINLDYKFAARSSNGLAKIKLNSDVLSKGLRAQLGGSYLIFSADLQAAIAKTVASMGADVYTEDSSSPVFNQIAANLVGQIISSDPTAIANGNSGYNGGLNSSYNSGYNSGYGSGWPGNGNGSGGYPGDLGNGTGYPPGTGQNPPPGVGVSIRVGAIFQYLKAKRDIDVSYQNMSRSEVHSYATSIIFRAAIPDPGLNTLLLKSMDKPGATYQQYLKTGTTLQIYPTEKLVEQQTERREKHYLGLDEARKRHLEKYFPSLVGEDSKYTQAGNADGPRAILFLSTGLFNPKSEFLAWGEEDLVSESEKSEWEEMILSTANFDTVPIQFSFSELGPRKFPLNELISVNDYWDGSYDTLGAKIKLKAKQNLGNLTLWNTDKFKTRPVVVRQYFEEHWSKPKNSVLSKQSPETARELAQFTEARSTIKVKVRSDAKEQDTPVQLEPFPQTSKDSPVIVP